MIETVVRNEKGIVVNVGKWPRLDDQELPAGYTETMEDIEVNEDGSRTVKNTDIL